jgi:ABC-2 type transport system ATP-binding protein
MSVAIDIRSVVKNYGALTAVDRVDLSIKSGECFGLLGPNGAGKTTLVEMMEGLRKPDGGAISLLGREWGRKDHQLRQRIGIALQETQFADKLSVEETVQLFRSFYSLGRSVDEVLDLVVLQDKRKSWVVKLSGGQKQRLAIACALVGQPEVLFLDEPTTGLDPQSRRNVWEIVRTYQEGGGTVVLTTHYMDEAEALCYRVAVMDHGQIIAIGTPDELIRRLDGSELIEFSVVGELPEERVRSLTGFSTLHRAGSHWRVHVDRLHLAVPLLLRELEDSGVELAGLATRRASLEDLFVSLTGRTLREDT